MSSRLASAMDVIAEARDRAAESLDLPVPSEDIWDTTEAGLADAWQSVGDDLRWAMGQSAAELASG